MKDESIINRELTDEEFESIAKNNKEDVILVNIKSLLCDASITDDTKQYFRKIANFPLLNKEEEYKLAKRASEGDNDAKDELFYCNTRLVISIAKQYLYNRHTLELMDLVNAGNEGLRIAIAKFDYTMGNRLSTYATSWIRRKIQQEIDNYDPFIKLPREVKSNLYKVLSVRDTLYEELGYIPSEEDIAYELDMDKDEVRELLSYSNTSTDSIDRTISDEIDGDCLVDIIQDRDVIDPKDFVSKNYDYELAHQYLSYLKDERQKEVIVRNFGLDDRTPETLDSIGKSLGLSRERARQIKNEALDVMRTYYHID